MNRRIKQFYKMRINIDIDPKFNIFEKAFSCSFRNIYSTWINTNFSIPMSEDCDFYRKHKPNYLPFDRQSDYQFSQNWATLEKE